jgi:hypothetical protein
MVGMTRGACLFAVMLLALTTACHKKDSKAAQLEALDEAYKSGVFTKEEYDARKQALTGTPAPSPTPPPLPATASTPPADAAQPAALPPPDATPAPAAVPAPATPRRAAASAPAPAQALPPPAPAGAAPSYPPSAAATPAEPEPAPLASCRDTEWRAGGPNGKQERFFVVSEDAVRRAAIQAFANLEFVIHDSTAHDMEAGKKGRLNTVVGGGTEKVVLHFSSARRNGQVGTRVVGETKRGFMGRVTQKSWTTAVLAQIACNLQ